MNAETGNEPESPKRRGRIPQSAWPQILERYRAGATLSAIAREFECTPSAISYIVRKADASAALPPGEGAAADPGEGEGAGSEHA
ncbi:MAG TPA: helix-turn-helix domain-containing protein, partial [Azospirillum sp.]